MGDSYITQAELEGLVGVTMLRDCADDDRDNVADTGVITNDIIEPASRQAAIILAPAFPSPEVVKNLMAADSALRMHVRVIAADMMAMRRRQFIDADGNTPYTPARLRAEKELRLFVKGEERSHGELTAGSNQIVPVRSTQSPDPFIFGAGTETSPARGGF